MVTCHQCIRVQGYGEHGNSWICKDCRVGDDLEAWKAKDYTKHQQINPFKHTNQK